MVSTEVLLAKPKRFVCEILRMPDGREIDWYYSDVSESVMVVPVTASGNVILVKQYRHNLKSDTLELPAGVATKGEPLASVIWLARQKSEEKTSVACIRPGRTPWICAKLGRAANDGLVERWLGARDCAGPGLPAPNPTAWLCVLPDDFSATGSRLGGRCIS